MCEREREKATPTGRSSVNAPASSLAPRQVSPFLARARAADAGGRAGLPPRSSLRLCFRERRRRRGRGPGFLEDQVTAGGCTRPPSALLLGFRVRLRRQQEDDEDETPLGFFFFSSFSSALPFARLGPVCHGGGPGRLAAALSLGGSPAR